MASGLCGKPQSGVTDAGGHRPAQATCEGVCAGVHEGIGFACCTRAGGDWHAGAWAFDRDGRHCRGGLGLAMSSGRGHRSSDQPRSAVRGVVAAAIECVGRSARFRSVAAADGEMGPLLYMGAGPELWAAAVCGPVCRGQPGPRGCPRGRGGSRVLSGAQRGCAASLRCDAPGPCRGARSRARNPLPLAGGPSQRARMGRPLLDRDLWPWR